jgi:hypothetical protein
MNRKICIVQLFVIAIIQLLFYEYLKKKNYEKNPIILSIVKKLKF